MADLLALQPNINIRLHIVAPEERRENVFRTQVDQDQAPAGVTPKGDIVGNYFDNQNVSHGFPIQPWRVYNH